MKLPNIYSHVSCHDYLDEFFKINKEESSKFSLTYFANRISWNRTYLHDISKRRKKLSLSRAIEFGNFFNLDKNQIGRLLVLTLIDNLSKQDKEEYGQLILDSCFTGARGTQIKNLEIDNEIIN